MTNLHTRFYLTMLLWLNASLLFSQTLTPALSQEVDQAMEAINFNSIEAHMNFLANDLLEGRKPGTKGFELGALYVKAQFEAAGLQPAGENGTFYQSVPMLHGVTNETSCEVVIKSKDKKTKLLYGIDFYISPDFEQASSSLNAPIVFAGYGITAPTFGYDSYSKTDVSGKIVLIMDGAPKSFPSNERAYFTSATTKYENAMAHGAIGVLSFSSSKNSRYTWEAQVRRSRQGIYRWADSLNKVSTPYNKLQLVGHLSEEAVQYFLVNQKTSLEQLVEKFESSNTKAVDLKLVVEAKTSTTYHALHSFNLAGKIEGEDPNLKNEYIVYVAHLDHFGMGVPVKGDSIYNGAHDNASGVSIVLETIKAYKALSHAPSRSILFLIVTGEEYGLQGSDYFVHHPTMPNATIVAALALDMPFFFHPLHDVVPYGIDHSSLKKEVQEATTYLGLKVSPDPIPEQVLFIRSDHFSFIRMGIPSLFIKSGFMTGDEEKDGRSINLEWRKEIYHSPQDDMNQPFDFKAGADHARLNFLIGYLVSLSPTKPKWNEQDFFGEKFGEH